MKKQNDGLNWKKELIEILIIFFAGGTLQELILDPADLMSIDTAVSSIFINGMFWALLWKGSQYLVILIIISGLRWVDQPLKTFFVAFPSIVIFTLVSVFLILMIHYVYFLNNSFADFINNLRPQYFVPALISTLMINTFMHGRAFLIEWKQAAVEVEKFKNESLKSQYESLKNQVNPHFLFNSLNALSSLVYDDQARAVEFIKKLSEVYRYVLEKQGMELVPLEDELNFLRNYVFLQQIRFGDNLKLTIKSVSTEGMIPPISLQILVENAIKHNIISENKPLKVGVFIDAGYCVVKNDIQEKLTKDSTGIGLNNLKSRYDFLSKEQMIIEKTETEFIVKIPILKLVK